MNFLDKLGLFFFTSDYVDLKYVGKIEDTTTRSKQFHSVLLIFK